ncbi:MAG: type II secretion system protein N [Thiohalophilus sp.]
MSRLRSRLARLPWSAFGWLGLGLLFYLLFLLARWPANHAWQQIDDRGMLPPRLEVNTVAGTIWHGELRRLNVAGTEINRVRWQVRFGTLLRGRLGVDIDAASEGGFLRGRVHLSPTRLGAENISGRLPAKRLEPIIARYSPMPTQVAGQLALAVEKLAMDHDGAIEDLDGRLAWHDGSVTVDNTVFKVGGLMSRFQANDGVIHGELDDDGGPLALDGQWQLRPDGRYRLDARPRARDQASDALRNALAPLDDRVQLEGRLK